MYVTSQLAYTAANHAIHNNVLYDFIFKRLRPIMAGWQQPRWRNGVVRMARANRSAVQILLVSYFFKYFFLFLTVSFQCCMPLIQFNVYFNHHLQNSLYMRL